MFVVDEFDDLIWPHTSTSSFYKVVGCFIQLILLDFESNKQKLNYLFIIPFPENFDHRDTLLQVN